MNRGGFTSPYYRAGCLSVAYRAPVARVPQPPPPAAPPPRPDLPTEVHALLCATAGVVTEKWDTYAAWIIAAFAAVAGLAVSNYDRAVELTNRSTVIAVLTLFIISVLLNAWQKWKTIRAQAMIAAGKAAQDPKLQLTVEEKKQFVAAMSAAYPAIVARWLAPGLERARTEGVAYASKKMMSLSVGATTLGFVQLGLGVIAAAWIVIALMLTSSTPPSIAMTTEAVKLPPSSPAATATAPPIAAAPAPLNPKPQEGPGK
ncbi:hypothetical protein [Variovorax sp. J31P207]|uniref:hypothetical protein n=1 Tax=Variovorax sp. J31P207 TaxID=3053510 RepID=UPI0025779D21|nr:hypothetical protein [Variovorax sp. J31P207]MDM0068369.1 hypothetical protein [Variovorax sp. J31P207]